MALTPQDVERLARLARIDLTPEELARLAPQLEVIIEASERVSEVATDGIEPTSHPMPLVNVFRTDVVAPSMPVADALAMAPAAEEGRFRVPRILEEEA